MKWFLSLLLFIFGCQSSNRELENWMNDKDRLKVVATTAIVADMVEAIGAESVNVIVLIKGDLDPHSYQLVKGDDEKLAYADLLVASGVGLEHGPSLQHYLENSEKTFSIGDFILQKHPDLILKVNGQYDPHIWMDMSLWSKGIDGVVKKLSEKLPTQASTFIERGEALKALWLTKHDQMKQILQEVPENKRFLVTSHDAFNYFARAYLSEEREVKDGTWTKRFKAPEGLAPENQLSLKNITDILEHVEKYHIHIIFPESNVSADSLKKIQNAAEERGFTMILGNPFLYGDAMGPSGSDGDTYVKMLIHNAKTVSEDLKEAP